MENLFKISIIFLIILAISKVDVCAQNAGSFSDKRDNKSYKTIKIGDLTWFAENLNFKTGGSNCYEDSESNCDKNGRLYTWASATNACPSGWHLPSQKEMKSLVSSLGSYSKFTESSGFNGSLPGWHHDSGYFGQDAVGNYWTATEASPANAWKLTIRRNSNDINEIYYGLKTSGFSVRCVQNK